MKFLGNTLDVVEPIHAYNQLDAFKLTLKDGDAVLYPLLLQGIDELLRVDAYRESCDSHMFAPELNTVWSCWCFSVDCEQNRSVDVLGERLTKSSSNYSRNAGHSHTYESQ